MQQYKYIKGSAEDFLGAPDWALESVWCDKGGDQMVYWLNKERGLAMMPLCPAFEWNGSYGYRCFVKAHREPIPEWNGDGLPPVGIKCEHCPGGTTQHEWEVVTVLAINERPSGVFTDYWLMKEDGSSYVIGNPYRFRPIRTEAERKREEVVNAISEICRSSASNGHSGELIYDAIAAGKIPGIKLES